MKKQHLFLSPLLLALALPGLAAAQDHSGHAGHAVAVPASNQDLSDGEITRWDARTQKITLRHGELQNLAMPPMTMVFTLRPPAQIGTLQVGSKVRFRAERAHGAFIVTHIEAAQ